MELGSIVIKVLPDAMQTGKSGQSLAAHGLDVSALSGGEKSLTSLILLSAIASVSNVPFRLIDEFDVFQDEATRKKSIQYLLEDAATTGEDGKLPQFVLLTPHDLSAQAAEAVGRDFPGERGGRG